MRKRIALFLLALGGDLRFHFLTHLLRVVELAHDLSLYGHNDVGNDVVQRECQREGKAEEQVHQRHHVHGQLHAALHLLAGSLHADVGGQEHSDDRQQRQHDIQRQTDLRDAGQVDAKEVHVLAELGDGSDLLDAEAAQHAAVACQYLGDDVGIAGDGGKGDAGGGHSLASAGQCSGADVENTLQRVIHHADNTEHDKEIQQHGHAAAHGVVAVLLLELHQLLLLLLGVVLVLLLDFIDHRCKHRHLGHGLLLFDHQRKHEQFDDHGENNHRDGEVRDHLIQHTHQRSQDHCEESHILSFRPARTQGIYFIKKVFAVR